MADQQLRLECACHSEILAIDWWNDEHEGYVEFYTAWRRKLPLKWRLKAMWATFRGRENDIEAVVLERPQIQELRDFCDRILQ